MSNIKDKAKEYLSYNLSVIPTTEDKLPALYSWEDLQHKLLSKEEVDTLFKGGVIRTEIEREITKKDKTKFIAKGIKSFIDPVGIGIITGAISGNLEVIDVDTKYDITGSLWEELKALIEGNLPEIYNSLVIAQTKSGGYHIYYRCNSIAGNLKLSNRLTTDQERAIQPNEKVKVLIETRGEGGYVIAPPTPGYKYIQGEPGNIPTITPQQREILFSIAKSFNEVEEEKPKEKATTDNTYNSTGLSPFDDYYNRGDVVSFLESKGWSIVNQQNQRVNLKRPGATDSKTSGNYHTEKRLLRVFSSSTEFNTDKAYTPTEIFILLECNGDKKEAYKKLLDLGYGEPYTTDTNNFKTKSIKVEIVNNVNKVISVISTPGGLLNIDSIKLEKGDSIVITSPGAQAKDEVLKAINVLSKIDSIIYIIEGGVELISYRYQLHSIVKKYEALRLEIGVLTDREINNLQEDIVETASKLKPIDKDQFIKEFIDNVGQDLGITQESLAITVDRLTTTRDKEAQATEFKKLLTEATALQDKGYVDKALELLDSRVKDVKATSGKGLLPTPLDFTTLLNDIANTPPSYKTGYRTLDKFIGFTPGAITLIAGRPSHGKTTFMFNLLLQMSNIYKDEVFYFFGYEEPVKNISIKLLNRLTATDLSKYYGEYNSLSKSTNYEFLKAYIKDNRIDIPEIEKGKNLLKDLIDSQKIKIIDVNYSVEQLSKIITYLNKTEKIGGVFIDYIQRMKTDRRTQDKRTEIAHISDMVLQIAKETGLPIILGAQLNRATQGNAGKKPALDNLKEAGNLEEDANTVISVYNESREKDETEEGDSYKGVREVELEIKTLKNREGEVNQTAILIFDRWTGLIKDKANPTGTYYK